MIRGTTPLLEFKLPFDTDLISEAYVTISQNNIIVIDKPLCDCSTDGRKLSVRLTQTETLLLDCTCNSQVQIRVRTTDGNALASKIITVNTGRILKDGVI